MLYYAQTFTYSVFYGAKMKFANWDNLFSEIILNRGHAYFDQGNIVSLTVKKGEATADVLGTSMYSVKIKWNGSKITDMRCNCPYDENCKHIAAVMYALEEKQEPNEKSENKLKEIVSKAEAGILRKFLLEILQDDEELAARFKILTAPSDKKLEIEPFVKKARKIASLCGDDYGFVDYYSLSDGMEKIEEIFKKDLPLFIEKNQFEDACELVIQIFDAFATLQDDDDGSLYMVSEVCTAAMSNILATGNQEAEYFLFDWCTEVLDSDIDNSYTMKEAVESFFEANFYEGEILERKLAYTKERGEAGSSHWMNTYLNSLEENGTRWNEMADYCKSHIENTTVRDWYINHCAEKGFTDEAILILEDACKSETDGYTLKNLKTRLKDLYSKKGDKEKLLENLWWLVENGGYSVNYLGLLNELKPFYDEKAWKTEREKIFSKTNGISLCELYKNEKLFDRMFPIVAELNSVSDIVRYADDLSAYSEELLDSCEEILQKQAQNSSSRNMYKDLARNLKSLRKIKGGEKRIKRLRSEWKVRYYRRSAMLEELGL